MPRSGPTPRFDSTRATQTDDIGRGHPSDATRAARQDSEAILVMTALLEDDPKKARNQYLKSCELDDVDDQEVHDLFQSRVFDAIMRHEPSVEIERELAQRLLLVVKNGIKRRRGGQRNTRQQRLRKRAVVDMACAIKAKLESKGMRATDARLEAAEAASGEARKRGIEYSPSYIQREMERLAKRQFGTRFR